jgi:ankyrin repeat protein
MSLKNDIVCSLRDATPALHKAAWLGSVDSIELLCQKGAEVDIKSKSYAATPLSKVSLLVLLMPDRKMISHSRAHRA